MVVYALDKANREKDMTTANNYRKTLHKLPDEVVDAFTGITDPNERNDYIVALRVAGWTLQSIAEAADITRERVRQIVKRAEEENSAYSVSHVVPDPPVYEEAAKPTYVEPKPETLEKLLELQPKAQQVRANSGRYRKEAEEYTALLNHAHEVEGVTLYRLAKRLGVSHAALRFRLTRYGYKEPAKGNSKVYAPILEENRYHEKAS